MSLHCLIIEFDFAITSNSFNNQFEHKSNLFESISKKFTSRSARLHP